MSERKTTQGDMDHGVGNADAASVSGSTELLGKPDEKPFRTAWPA
jgi:hypothetical protein